MQYIGAEQAKAMLSDGEELAFLDVREHGQYGEGHPLFAVNCPYSILELRLPLLVPRRSVRVVLLDGGNGIAERAAARMSGMGYSETYVVRGGAPAWAEAGYVLFQGVNVPSKCFGELVEHEQGTPSISAADLKRMIDEGEDLVVLDGRSPGEYARMNIPTAQSCPNAELGYRIADIAPDPSTRIVVNCAGRTRSIIGAQTLLNLGVPNSVCALRNGSQGWQLAGFELEYGSAPTPLAELSDQAAAVAKTRARTFAQENGIPFIDRATLARWQEDPARTTYVLDVRTAEEFSRGHLPEALHAPGGQLVQATDQWIAVRNARIVLTCDLGPRAATTCFWLRGMGHDAYVLDSDVSALPGSDLANGTAVPRPDLPRFPALAPTELESLLQGGALLVDVSPGQAFRRCHIAGAVWGIRPHLDKFDDRMGRAVIVAGRDAGVAKLAAKDLVECGHEQVSLLEGGPEEWRAAGLPMVADDSSPSDQEMIDFLFFVHDRHSGALASARQYLEWETGLVGQLDPQERAVFDPAPPAVPGRRVSDAAQ